MCLLVFSMPRPEENDSSPDHLHPYPIFSVKLKATVHRPIQPICFCILLPYAQFVLKPLVLHRGWLQGFSRGLLNTFS